VNLPDSTRHAVKLALRAQRYELQRWLHIKTGATEDARADVRLQVAQLNLAIDTLDQEDE
jgi:hypothetical protein